MNFLAHAFLARDDDDLLLGSMMGDFVKGTLDGRYAPAITRGLSLHRAVDTYTDAHALVVRSRARVSAQRRRYAGILIDLWEFERGGDKVSVKVGGWLCSNDREVVLAAVLAGEGVARFSEASTRSQLQSGRLVPVLPDWEVQGGPPLNLLYRASNRRTPRVRLLLDFIVGLVQQFEAEGTAGAPRAGIELPQWHRKGYGRASSVLRWRG